jgi:hypothetical protein
MYIFREPEVLAVTNWMSVSKVLGSRQVAHAVSIPYL